MNKFFLLLIFISNISFSQLTEFHPELNWLTIKGKHCQVHFHDGAERTAKVVCKIADEVWEPITSLYENEPETVHYVIKDIDDYSNGATYFFDNKIEIWASALDFDLRGTHNWLRNVISHEFTHLVQIQASLKTTRRIPAAYLQYLNYEDERRPDILYGFPNVIVSYPLAFINMPAWFAEGTAQYMRKEFDYDRWDTHRDMILRCYAIDGNMLSWNQMGVFEKTSLGNESVYNSGFALTRYISQKFGEDKLREITKKLGRFSNFSIDAAFKDVLQKDGIEVYNEWKNFISKNYNDRIKKVKENLVFGDTINFEGFGNFYPIFSNDGTKIFYISNKTEDYFGLASIYSYDLKSKEEKKIVTGVRSTFSFIPNTNKIVYAKLSEDNPDWANVHDIYIYDIDNEKEERLTNGLRANQPFVSNNGKKIVFISQIDGTTNLCLIDIDGKNFQRLTQYQNGEQVYNPKFSKDDSFLIFDYSYHQTRDIAKINSDGSSLEFIIRSDNDERNPVIDNESNIIYSSDKTGIYNLYKINPTTKEEKQLTNVIGGAFMPSIDKEGNITYSLYTSTGYKIFLLKKEDQNKAKNGFDYEWIDNPPLEKDKPNGDINKINITNLKGFNDYLIPDYKKEKYSGSFTKLMIFPFVRFDNYNTSNKLIQKIKPGVYVTSSDMLNRYSIFGGASINSRLERDLFLILDFRNKFPLIFDLGLKPELSLELYNISRKANVDILFEEYPVIQTDVTYNLFEFDIVARHRIFSRENNLEFRYTYNNYTAILGSFIIPGTEPAQLYPSTTDTYLIGSIFQVTYKFENYLPYVDAEINPVGSELELKYGYELNKYNPEGEYKVEDGMLVPLYKDFFFHKLELNIKHSFKLFDNHTLSIKNQMGNIFGPTVPDFFDFYAGGLIGIKAYPFYSISGNKIFWTNLTYRFPLFKNIDAKIGHLYLDKIFLSIYGDIANAWNGKRIPDFNSFKKGIGTELRFALNSFYLFPTGIFFNASYGFDRFDRTFRKGTSSEKTVTYGGEWRFYAGVLFGFEI